MMLPSLSWELEPFNLTKAPCATIWSDPALATGGELAPVVWVTVTVTSSEAEAPRSSVTVRRKVNVAALDGAVKLATEELPLLRVTEGVPPTWVHR